MSDLLPVDVLNSFSNTQAKGLARPVEVAVQGVQLHTHLLSKNVNLDKFSAEKRIFKSVKNSVR